MTIGAVVFAVLAAVLPSYVLLLIGNITMLYWPPGQPSAPPPIVTRGDWAAAARRTAKQLMMIWLLVLALCTAGFAVFLATSG